ncbi:MAG: Ig-like domain-containing protein [Lachnospiraceae bacterium]|nr:Ig-like domain-containing protein [Lachnospiraceae bacterium]
MTGKNGIFTKKALCMIIALVLTFSGINVPGTGLPVAEVTEAEAATAKLSKSKKTLNVGKSFTLKVKNASKKYKFESSNPSVAKVKTKSGKKTKVVAVSAGKATITATLGSKVLKCVVIVKDKKATVTPVPTPVPTPIPTGTVLTDGTSVFDLVEGGKIQLKLSGKEVRRYYISDSDKQYLDVTEDGLVTAKKAASNPVTVKIEDKSYYYYQCKIRVNKADSAVPTPTPETTPAPTKAPTVTPVPTTTAAPTATPTPTKAPSVTNVPTSVEEPSTPYISPEDPVMHVGDKLQLTLVGATALDFFVVNDGLEDYIDVTSEGLVTAKKPISYVLLMCLSDKGNMYTCEIKILSGDSDTGIDKNGIGNREHYDLDSMSAEIELGDTYGLITSHTREAYRKTIEDYSIEDERGFIKACRDALEHGVESFTIKFRGYDGQYWWNKFKDRLYYYSDLSGYTADGFSGYWNDSDHTITIMPAYKDVWKAVTYLRYSGYEADDDVKKLLNAAMALTKDAIAANPGDTRGILLYVNNRICEMTTYTKPIPTESDCPQRDATGVFFYGDGVCESYTAAMRLVLNILGLQNDTIVNKKGKHIWNRVMLDGTWYHIDVTWNDIEDKWNGGYYNDYFLLTESELIRKSTETSDENERLDHLWNNFYN